MLSMVMWTEFAQGLKPQAWGPSDLDFQVLGLPLTSRELSASVPWFAIELF